MSIAAEIIDVDEDGFDAEGTEFGLFAHDDKVKAGLLVNQQVKLRFPNGAIRAGNRVLITPAGRARIAKLLGQPLN